MIDKEAMLRTIIAKEANLKVLQGGIEKVEDEIKEYEKLIEVGSDFDDDSLRAEIELKKHGVRTIKGTIMKEEVSIKEWQNMIEEAERMAEKREMVANGVTIEAVRE